MKLAAKQLLALGVNPTLIRELDERADGEDLQLRELVQRLLGEGIHRGSLILALEAEKHAHRKDNEYLIEQRNHLLELAERLFQMVPREAWRATGGDDQQGHYEGDYHQERVGQELARMRAEVA